MTQILFNEIFCNDRLERDMRSCKVDPARYTIVCIVCIAIAILILLTSFFNSVYKIKDWMNRYDYMSLNQPNFHLFLEVYISIRSISDSLPFDEMNEYFYYTKCLLIAIYSSNVLVYSYRQIVFQSEQIQI